MRRADCRRGGCGDAASRAGLMPHTHTFGTWDDYVIPGTVVLHNKFTAPGKPYGEPDAAKLRLVRH